MKKSVAITIIALLLFTHCVAQQLEYKTVVRDYSKILLLEGGVNLSVCHRNSKTQSWSWY
jgi:hypothetical protein